MASTEAVANFFLKKSFNEGTPLTPMQLLKLVYIAHGWHRGYFQQDLIDDAVEAWRYGPVIPNLYHQIKHYGRGHITAMLDEHDGLKEFSDNPPNPQTLEMLDHVWASYRGKGGIELSALTHQPGTPWDKVWKERGRFSMHEIIPNDLIEAHYREMVADN